MHNFFPEVKNNEKLADIAGGAGIVSAWLSKRGYDVTLVEFSSVAIESAKSRGLKVVQSQLEGVVLPFADCSFDVVFFGDIIEHLFDPESILKEIKRILKPGGKIVLSCPNTAYWRFRWYYLVDGDLQRVDVAKLKPWEQEHIRFYNIRILKEFFGKLGFTFIKFQGTNSIWHSRYLVKYFPGLFGSTIVVEFAK